MRKKNKVKYRTVNILISIILFSAIVIMPSYTTYASSMQQGVLVDVTKTIQRLIEEEDTDGDKKITVDDHGDKHFWVMPTKGQQYEIQGTYYLSNLLQELKISEENGHKTTQLDPTKIFENPVRRISRCIREIYWDGLTRRIDEESVIPLFNDTKTTTVDGYRYIYVPYNDEIAYEYFSMCAQNHPGLKIKAVRLPEEVTPEWVWDHNGHHGLLSLALRKNSNGHLEGVPFVVPGGRFNEMYGWDSYFEALGLLQDGRGDLAAAMVDNFVYEINYYGKILNANRSYYLTRSQPPFLTSMALAVYEYLPKDTSSKEWLKSVFQAAIKEYYEVWMGEKRLTKTGLSRYFGEGIGPPPEVEPGHFDADYARIIQQVIMSVYNQESERKYSDADYAACAKRLNMDTVSFNKTFKAGSSIVPLLESFFKHDRSMRESGHDKTYRWENRCADFVTVDLNSLLYKIEMDIARTIQEEFEDSLKLKDGSIERSSIWYERAKKRKELMNQYLWDSEHGLFLDYDLVNKQRKVYISAVAFYPLWAGIASREQAKSIVETVIPALEMPGGLAGSSEESRGPVSESRPALQWDYPYGWAPHQMLTWYGLIDYGYDEIAQRLIYRWLYTITSNAADYNGTIPEKFDVVSRSHRVFAEYGNVGTKFSYITKEGFGWMNASYQVGLEFLTPDLRIKLEQLIAPEWLFEQ